MGNVYLPKIIFEGEDALEQLINYLDSEGFKRIFIVTDKNLCDIGILDILIDNLKEFKYKIFNDVEPEPSINTVEKLGDEIIRFKPDAIIALGGGSVIDAAKGGWVKYEKPDMNLEEISPFIKIGTGRKSILISIPTTSGTGSEATLGVVYSKFIDDRKIKIALGSYELISNIVVLDPRFTLNLPKNLTLYTGLDALSHAVESLVSTEASEFTDALAEKVITNIFETLPDLLNNLNDISLRRKMHILADMAGIAFSNSGLGLAHGIGHIIGGLYHIHHGKAVSIPLPYVVKYNYKSEKASKKYNWISSLLYERGLADKAPFYNQLYNFISKIGGEVKYEDSVDKNKYFDEMDEYIPLILQDPDVIYNPIVPDEEDIKKILYEAYYGELS